MSSLTERAFIQQGAELDVRLDGRSRLDYRPWTMQTGVVDNASGSARIHLDETDVIVVVKGEIGQTEHTRPGEGRIACCVKCGSTIAETLQNETRRIENLNTELTTHLERLLLGGSLDLKPLVIIPGKTCWVLNVDVLVLSDGGSLVDAIGLATKAALASTRLPRTIVSEQESGEMDFDITGDPTDVVPIEVSDLAVMVCLTKIGGVLVVDAAREEEQCRSLRLCVWVDPRGHVLGMLKTGLGALAPLALVQAISLASSLGTDLCRKLQAS